MFEINPLLLLFLQGMLIGLAMAAPPGPISTMYVHRTFTEGRLSGGASALGAVFADVLYGCIAAFGLTAVAEILVGAGDWLRPAGGFVLCLMGLKLLLSKQGAAAGENSSGSRRKSGAFASTFLLTMTNPMTLITFTAMFAGLGMGSREGTIPSSMTIVLGVFSGSILWTSCLVFSASLLRNKLLPRLALVNKASGALIVLFGVVTLAGVIG